MMSDLITENLCVYDPRSDVYLDIDGGKRSDHCSCDRCFYGRDRLALELEAKDKRIAALEEERYALLYQNNKDAHRIAELEHWFHGYKTPEESMSAMLQRIDELEAELDAWEHGTDIHDAVAPLNALLDKIGALPRRTSNNSYDAGWNDAMAFVYQTMYDTQKKREKT